MRNRLKFLSLLMTALLINCICAGTKTVTTNDVDEIFREIDVFSIGRLGRRVQDVGLNDARHSPGNIRHYAFDKLLSIPVWTNSVRAYCLLEEKASRIEVSEWLFGIRLTDADLREILKQATTPQPVSTNDLAELREQAFQLDLQRDPWRKYLVNSANPGRNFIRWRNLNNRVKEWNKSVADYRRRLVAFVCEKYDELHRDVPEAERREALRALLREYGFSLPDPEPTDRELHTFEHSLPPWWF